MGKKTSKFLEKVKILGTDIDEKVMAFRKEYGLSEKDFELIGAFRIDIYALTRNETIDKQL